MLTYGLLALDVVLLAAAIVLGASLIRARRSRHDLARTLEQVEADKGREIREGIDRRVQQEQKRLRREADARRAEVDKQAQDLAARQADVADRRRQLEERAAALDSRAEELAERTGTLDARTSVIDEREVRIATAEDGLRKKLEEIARLTTEQAREQIVAEVTADLQADIARLAQKSANQARGAAEEAARDAVLQAMSSLRGATATEGTISILTLPSDEMKGRIIGREGRNIRSLEHATGVDLLVDDTPRAIMLSSWDPLRRLIAARSVRKLVEDGRIHPARIEEVVERTREETDEEARERGEAVAYELSVNGLHERLVLLVGRLSFLSDHGHNLLLRARDVGMLAGAIGDELRIGGDPLRRAGLLHEVARADKTPLLAPAIIASADLAQRFGEDAAVTAAIRALAQPPDAPRTPHGVVLTTARRFVLARPGARDENLQRHMDRLRDVEQIALAHEGIERAVAVRAGREVRVHVRADATPDEGAILLARELAREIEQKIDFPGQIRVLVIRETRAVSYAV
jgi:ribonuclease Y